MTSHLLTGNTGVVILAILEKEDMYGYKIAREIKLRSGGVFSLKEGTLYPILHSFEKKGFTTTYLQTADGRERKYYHLTLLGKTELSKMKKKLKEQMDVMKSVLSI